MKWQAIIDTVRPQQHKITDMGKYISLGSELVPIYVKKSFLMVMQTSTTIKLPTSQEIISGLSNVHNINTKAYVYIHSCLYYP